MKILKSLAIVLGISLVFLCSTLNADEWDKETKVTFSGPVQIQNTQLAAGTYVFKLADTADRHIVQIFNEDETQVLATIIAIPDYRVTPTDNTVVKFAETGESSQAAGTVPENGIPIKEWFYPGDNFGNEFKVVPTQTAAAVTPEAPPAPPAQPAAAAPPAETPQPEATPEPAAPQAQAETPQSPPAEAPPAAPPAQLPQTASDMPLIGLLGLASLVAAASLRAFLKLSA
ncbi:MAG: hypothetical protein ACLQVG_18270 [Terriglobia bacterium]